jgi:hypothetical protein
MSPWAGLHGIHHGVAATQALAAGSRHGEYENEDALETPLPGTPNVGDRGTKPSLLSIKFEH